MKWIKNSGMEIETNDLPATISHCLSIGWEKKERKKRAKNTVLVKEANEKEDE